MFRWSDKSHEDRQPQEGQRPVPQPQTKGDAKRADGTQRRVEQESHRWRRADRPTTAAEWEVSQFHRSAGGCDPPRA